MNKENEELFYKFQVVILTILSICLIVSYKGLKKEITEIKSNIELKELKEGK